MVGVAGGCTPTEARKNWSTGRRPHHAAMNQNQIRLCLPTGGVRHYFDATYRAVQQQADKQ